MDKELLDEVARALYYVIENGDPKTFNLDKYEELFEKIQEHLQNNGKICPLNREHTCTERCALFIRMWKPREIAPSVYDPESILEYEGCGLVNQVPWKIVKRKEASER